jgi:hypothetical protein
MVPNDHLKSEEQRALAAQFIAMHLERLKRQADAGGLSMLASLIEFAHAEAVESQNIDALRSEGMAVPPAGTETTATKDPRWISPGANYLRICRRKLHRYWGRLLPITTFLRSKRRQ